MAHAIKTEEPVGSVSTAKRYHVAAVFSHPIQYFSPLFREITANTDVDLTVYYASDAGAEVSFDPGFGTAYRWDIPLLDGHRHVFLSRGRAPGAGPGRVGALRLWREIASRRYDALWVHGYRDPENWVGFVAAAARRTPLLLRGESNLVDGRPVGRAAVKETMLRPLVRLSAACLYIGSLNRAYYEHYGARPEQLFPMPYAVDNDFFAGQAKRLRPERETIRRRFGIDDEAPVIVSVGKLIEKKAPLDLLLAFARLRRTTPCHLLFAGDGPLRGAIEAEVERSGIPDVHITGFLNQTEVPRAYTAADVLVLPSRFAETWGLVINEGMNFGLPVVVSDRVGCGPDLVHEGRNGCVFPAGDIDALSQRLELLLAHADLRTGMGEASRSIIAGWGLPQAAEGMSRAVASVAGGRP